MNRDEQFNYNCYDYDLRDNFDPCWWEVLLIVLFIPAILSVATIKRWFKR